jgi:hypothetical protein
MPKSGPPAATLAALLSTALLAACAAHPPAAPALPKATRNTLVYTPLFPKDGPPAGWTVHPWTDVAQEAPSSAGWRVENGILTSGTPRGSWLVSDAEYGDFTLECEFRLPELGNAGFALRFPAAGDPSVQGFEIQWVDPRYFGTNYPARDLELSGAIFRVLPPLEQAYRPLEWNRFTLSAQGSRLVAELNGRRVIDTNLATQSEPPTHGLPLAQRPARGKIGFQEISRGTGRVEIRNARIGLPSPSPRPPGS